MNKNFILSIILLSSLQVQTSFYGGAWKPSSGRSGSAVGKRCKNFTTGVSDESLGKDARRGIARVAAAPKDGREVHGFGCMNRTALLAHAGKPLEETNPTEKAGHYTHAVAYVPRTGGRAPLRATLSKDDDNRKVIPTAPVGDSTLLSCAALRGRSVGRQGRGVTPVLTGRSASAGRKAYDHRGDSSAMKQCMGQEPVPTDYMDRSRLSESLHGSARENLVAVGFAARGPDTPTPYRVYSADGRGRRNGSSGVTGCLNYKSE